MVCGYDSTPCVFVGNGVDVSPLMTSVSAGEISVYVVSAVLCMPDLRVIVLNSPF